MKWFYGCRSQSFDQWGLICHSVRWGSGRKGKSWPATVHLADRDPCCEHSWPALCFCRRLMRGWHGPPLRLCSRPPWARSSWVGWTMGAVAPVRSRSSPSGPRKASATVGTSYRWVSQSSVLKWWLRYAGISSYTLLLAIIAVANRKCEADFVTFYATMDELNGCRCHSSGWLSGFPFDRDMEVTVSDLNHFQVCLWEKKNYMLTPHHLNRFDVLKLPGVLCFCSWLIRHLCTL